MLVIHLMMLSSQLGKASFPVKGSINDPPLLFIPGNVSTLAGPIQAPPAVIKPAIFQGLKTCVSTPFIFLVENKRGFCLLKKHLLS
jgi:hypothetical protein